jgi:hypothetical protein
MITKMLDLSTGHVSKDTRDILDEAREGSLRFRHVRHTYGWIIWIGGMEMFEDIDFSPYPELREIYLYAVEEDCMLINFDADGDIEGFPTFDW